jgi:hypothetical protein
MIAGIALAIILLTVGALLLRGAWRRSHRPAELRGDWWSAFERDFRVYARRSASKTRARRTSDPRFPPQ